MTSSNPRVVIAGASGLIGSALTRSFEADGVTVTRLVRRAPHGPDEVQWAPGIDPLSPDVVRGADAVIGLNGASIGRLPWTRSYRSTLHDSRIKPTRTLTEALRALGSSTTDASSTDASDTDVPQFVSASAVGYYGSRPGETLTEPAAPATTFLAGLCAEWEAAAREAGPRVTLLRTSPLIHPDGVLKPLMRLTRFGLSGPLGPGTQLWPWISLADEVRAIRHIVAQRITGPVNLTGPTPATATETGRALANAMRRPFIVPAPAFALRLALGEAADALLLSDARVVPAVLMDSGFEFHHKTVDTAIAAALDES